MTKPVMTVTPDGENIVILSRDDYERLVEEKEDAIDAQAIIAHLQACLDGTVELHSFSVLEH